MDDHEAALLDETRDAMQADSVRLNIVRTFTNGPAVQIEARPYTGRWKKYGPLLFPPEGGTLADVLTMLAEMRERAAS